MTAKGEVNLPGGVLPEKLGRGVQLTAQNPCPIFGTLFMTWPNIGYPIYNHCDWHSCPKHNLRRAFVDDLTDNDEKVACSKKHTQFKTRVLNPIYHTIPSLRRKWPKSISYLLPKRLKNHTLWSRTYTYIAHIYILLTKREGRTGGISARGLNSTRADILPARSRASLVNKRFIIRLKKALKVFHKFHVIQ